MYDPFYKSLMEGTAKNIPCENAPSSVSGCALEWCKHQPALKVWQLFGGIMIGTIGYPYAISITQSIFSKIIGPRPQGMVILVLEFPSGSRT